MLIQRLEVKNYRSLRSIDLDFRELEAEDDTALLALLGRNGAGKSSVLYALDVFYDTAAKVTKDDCFARDPDNKIEIRVTYGQLRSDELQEFTSYVKDGQLIVTKRIEVGEKTAVQKYYAAAQQIPVFAEMRKMGKRDRTKEFKSQVASGELEGLAGTPKSADQVDALMAEYEAAHPELLETVEREEQFFGPRQIGGGKLDKFTKFVLVPAVRDAAGEEERKGVIYELIDMIVLRQVNKREDVKALRKEMRTKIEEVYSAENLTELGELGASISGLLGQYAPGSALRLLWGDPIVPSIPLPKAEADLVEDDFPCPITHAGHGLQRSLILTLLQYLALIEPPAEEGDEPASDDGPESDEVDGLATEVLSPDLILAIEEPELYLHPGRCRHLSTLLLDLARLPKEPGDPRNQFVYATHSPYFVDLHRFDQVRIARKQKVDGLAAPPCVIGQYSLDQAAEELARIADGDAAKFTRDSFRARALPIMTTAVNEGFFSNAVVVVEGLSDLGVLWTLQAILGKKWDSRGIVVVAANGKENIDRPVVVFRGLKIPTYFVFDADNKHEGKKKEKEAPVIRRNRRYQRMAEVEPQDFPGDQVHNTWAVFADEMETAIRTAVGEDFQLIAGEVVEELAYDGVKSLMKNTEGASRLIEKVYEAGHTVPILEDIVDRVTLLTEPDPQPAG